MAYQNTKKELINRLSAANDMIEQLGSENQELMEFMHQMTYKAIEYARAHNDSYMDEYEFDVTKREHNDVPNMKFDEMSDFVCEALENFCKSAAGLRSEVSEDQALMPHSRREQDRFAELSRRLAPRKGAARRGNRHISASATASSAAPITPPKSDVGDYSWTKSPNVEIRESPSPAPRQTAKDGTIAATPVPEIKTTPVEKGSASKVVPPASPSVAKTTRKSSSNTTTKNN